MSMNHDTVVAYNVAMDTEVQSVYDIRQRECQSGKRWARRGYIATSQSYITKLQERRRLGLLR